MADKEALDAAYLTATEEFLLEFAASAEFMEAQHRDNIGGDSRSGANSGRSVAEQQRAKAADRRTRYRKKLQDEREMLKRQERELTAKLAEMQDAQAKAKVEARRANTLALSAWRAATARQKERRLEVEQQQQRLKAAVLSRSQLISQMNALLPQPLTNALALCEGHATTPVREASGALLFKTFVRELDVLFEKTDDIMSGIKFKVAPPKEVAMTRRWNQARTLLESSESTVLPFGFERTWRALSELMLSDPGGSHHEGDIAADPDNTAAIKYVETERVVFVWRVLTEGQGVFDGLYSNENAWLVIRPTSAAKAPSTTLESYARLQLVGLDEQPALSDARGHRFAKVLQKMDDEDVGEIKRALWRMLSDEP